MKIKNPQEAQLSNYEVYSCLKSRHQLFQQQQQQEQSSFKSRFNRNINNQSLLIVSNPVFAHGETLKYLQDSPSATVYSAEKIRAFLEKMRNIPITKAERLQILNLCPTKPVDLYPIIEELEERFPDESDIESLLNIIASTLLISE